MNEKVYTFNEELARIFGVATAAAVHVIKMVQ